MTADARTLEARIVEAVTPIVARWILVYLPLLPGADDERAARMILAARHALWKRSGLL